MRCAVSRIGYDHACIAARAEIFRRIKAKARDITERPGAPALVAGSDGLRGVFDNWNILFSREFHDWVHVRAEAVEVDNHDGTRTRSHAAFELRRIDVVSIGVNVRIKGPRSQRAHYTSGSEVC